MKGTLVSVAVGNGAIWKASGVWEDRVPSSGKDEKCKLTSIDGCQVNFTGRMKKSPSILIYFFDRNLTQKMFLFAMEVTWGK